MSNFNVGISPSSDYFPLNLCLALKGRYINARFVTTQNSHQTANSIRVKWTAEMDRAIQLVYKSGKVHCLYISLVNEISQEKIYNIA